MYLQTKMWYHSPRGWDEQGIWHVEGTRA